MVLETLAMLSGVKDLFLYNRQSYQFNKTLDQERLYHLQKMRIEQVGLFRDDIRDLFNLVVIRMNNYYLVNTLALGFSLGFYYEGKIPTDIPSWLYWLWTMSLASAIVYLFLSVWFAVHASVVAQMFSTRLLTQWMRLPVPGPAQIDAGAPKLEEFEKASVKESLRVPMVGTRFPVNSSSATPNGSLLLDPPTTADKVIQDDYTAYMEHFYMFVRLQRHWMSLDAYCRVCMVLGCNQILYAITYTGLAYFALDARQWGAVAFCLLPIVFACVHVHMNLALSRRESMFFLTVHSLAPILASIAAAIETIMTVNGNADGGATIAQSVALASYVCHAISWTMTTKWGLERNEDCGGLPTRFVTVSYIDVLGLLKERLEKLGIRESPKTTPDKSPDESEVVPPFKPPRMSRAGSTTMSVSGHKIDNVPDVIATMPRVAFRLVGITVLLLWVFGIVFGALSLYEEDWIGWGNQLVVKKQTVQQKGHHMMHKRRSR
jgi:hypothetical protein